MSRRSRKDALGASCKDGGQVHVAGEHVANITVDGKPTTVFDDDRKPKSDIEALAREMVAKFGLAKARTVAFLAREARVTGASLDRLVQMCRDAGIEIESSVDIVDQNPPGAGIVAPHYHVSATHRAGAAPRACTDEEMERVSAAFGMSGAEEDNHGPGIARHLWLLCGRDREPECPCKLDEDRTVEGPRVRHDASPAGGGS